MERIKTLNYYQKGIIIVMVAMILIFAVIYPKTISRVGYRYNDEILVPNQENGNIVYSGKINGVPTQFIVSKEKSIVLQIAIWLNPFLYFFRTHSTSIISASGRLCF